MRFGLVGVGGIGQIRAQSLKTMAHCRLAGVTDVDAERAKALAQSSGAECFAEFAAMVASPDIEAVIISTPPQFHEKLASEALGAGKHVLCEKPLSNDVESCRRMVETARAAGRVLTTGFNHRYFPAIQVVKRAIDEGLIGELDHVRAFGGHTGLSEFKAPWMYDKKVMGGGALMDVGIHLLDLTRYLLGDVTEVFGVATDKVWNLNGVEDNALALLRNARGQSAVLQATWDEWKGYRFHVEAYGDKGMARAYYAPMTSTVIRLDEPGGRREVARNFYPLNIVREKFRGWQSTVITTFQRELSDFAALCADADAKSAGIIADGFAGFRAVEIANAVYQSTQTKEVVRLSAPF